MHTKTSPYEVRCPRCNVSFPVETKRCIHCDGRTVSADQIDLFESASSFGYDGMEDVSETSVPSEEKKGFRLPDFGSTEREVEPGEEPTSVVRSIIRGLGGFIWIIVLIGFSLARSCGGE